MKPSSPIRKSGNYNTDSAGRVKAGSNQYAPKRQSAQPFGTVDASIHKHPSAGVTPQSVPINDKDAGKGTGNVRGSVPGNAPHMGFPKNGGE